MEDFSSAKGGLTLREKIYEIPVRDAFASSCACPFCRLQSVLEAQEIERISGAAMMEPDVRIETNAMGFCEKHFSALQKKQRVLPLALLLESHLDEVRKSCTEGEGKKAAKAAEKIASSCYVCHRVSGYMEQAFSSFAFLWRRDADFRDQVAKTEGFCLPHYARLLAISEEIPRKERKDYEHTVMTVMHNYLTEKRSDISDFCKQFDYRAAGNAPVKKSAPAAAIYALTGGVTPPEEEE